MGSGASLVCNDIRAVDDFPRDYRVNRCIKTFQMPDDKINYLWILFKKYDRANTGKMLLEDYFSFVLAFPRSKITDSMFAVIDTSNDYEMNFGEFFELTCTFSCFEKKDLFEYLFFVLDAGKSGYIDRHELFQLIEEYYDGKPNTNVKMGLEYLEEIDDGDRLYDFNQIWEAQKRHPSTFSCLGLLQQRIIARSLGEWWWANHKAELIEKKEEAIENELKMLQKQQQEAEDKLVRVNDDLVEERLGYWRFRLMPWLIEKEREQVARMLEIEGEYADYEKTNREKSLRTMLIKQYSDDGVLDTTE